MNGGWRDGRIEAERIEAGGMGGMEPGGMERWRLQQYKDGG